MKPTRNGPALGMGPAGRAWLIAAAVFLSPPLAGPLAAQGLFDSKPIFDYARNRDTSAVEYYLKKGAKIDDATYDGETVLTIAAGNGDLQLVEVALDHGARVSHEDKYGKTALCYAAERGHASVIEKLLGAGADINHQTQDGLTPVMLAVRFDRLAALRALLSHKPDLTVLDYTGRSALGWAQQSRDRRAESMLKRAGATD